MHFFWSVAHLAFRTPFTNLFDRKHYDSTARLWESVREEVQALLGVLPTMRAQLARKWQTEMNAADACESSYGAVTASVPQPFVSTYGRVSERSRFRMQRGGKSAREHALHSAR